MILDVHGEPFGLRDRATALRHRPREQHAVVLQPEVVVQVAGEMLLHAEEQPLRRALRALGATFAGGSGVLLKSRFC